MRTLLSYLKQIRDEYPPKEQSGICGNVAYLGGCEDYGADIEHLALAWPKHSGSLQCPVPHPTVSPVIAYSKAHYQSAQWDRDTEYGRNRWELLGFLIEELSK